MGERKKNPGGKKIPEPERMKVVIIPARDMSDAQGGDLELARDMLGLKRKQEKPAGSGDSTKK